MIETMLGTTTLNYINIYLKTRTLFGIGMDLVLGRLT